MFSQPIDTLIAFTVTTPLMGWLETKIRLKNLCGVYVAVGLVLSGLSLRELFVKALSGPVTLPVKASPLSSCLVIDRLSVFMALISTILGLLATVYSIEYMKEDDGIPFYYTLLSAMTCGMLGVAFAGDFFTLFVFWELMCISSYALVAFRKHEWEPIEAGLKYLVMSSAGSASILFGISLLYGLTGTLSFTQTSSMIVNSSIWGYVSLSFILLGFGVKAAIFPLHMWLPDAHPAAPTPISALLSGIVIKTGVYAIIRSLFSIYSPINSSWQAALMAISILTMSYGNLAALLQDDIKRLLAYSSIAQMGYILFAVSTATTQANAVLGLTAALMHIMNHALMKCLLFLCAGAFIYRAGTRSLARLSGIGRRMPLTAVTFAIGALAISGIPPLNGFISELMIIYSGIRCNAYIPTVILLANILLGFAYYLRLIRIIIWSSPSGRISRVHEAPFLMLIPIVLLALACVAIGIYPSPFIEFARQAAESLIASG
ncbi:cation:proton antiporter [Candidatus Bathyarchaeota archaeon]|nr:cation:proton antiporter [Candidatus Bathyarchaeota archaeon]